MNYRYKHALSPRRSDTTTHVPQSSSSPNDRTHRRQLVLIIGATAGPGLALTYHHASLGNDLILVGRRKKPLDDLAAQLRHLHQHQIDIFTHSINLSAGPWAAERLFQSIAIEQKLQVDAVVCNSDFGRYDTTTSRRILEDDTSMLGPTLHTCTVLTLARLFADDMTKRGVGGSIIHVGSDETMLDGPADAMAVYDSVTKFSRSVRGERRPFRGGVMARIPNHIRRTCM